MQNQFVTKQCAHCSAENIVYSEEYKNEISKNGYESAGYIALEQFVYINIEHCNHCGYCNDDISKLSSHEILHSEKYQSLQNYSKFEENADNYYHTLLIGAYVLESNKEYLNASRAYYAVRKNLGNKSYNLAKESLNEAQLKKYQPVFDYYQKIKDYCLDQAIELSKKAYSLTANIDALVMLLYLLKEGEHAQEFDKLNNALAELNLNDEQKNIVNTINLLPY